DAWWAAVEGDFDPGDVTAVAEDAASPAPALPRTSSPGVCEGWDNGSLDDLLSPRSHATAVWTGSVMIVWGGGEQDQFCPSTSAAYQGGAYQDGSRYDPLTDTWSLISRVNAPNGRFWHTAVWTGTEMIVWGGWDVNLSDVNDGGRYDPASDSWRSVS